MIYPKVSIIIPIYNGEKHLRRLFESISRQTYSNYEIIIAYDTKTTDLSLSILSEYSSQMVIYVDMDCDSSLGAARNRGFKFATGEFIVHVDCDDELESEYLSSMAHVLIEEPSIDAVCCKPLAVSSITEKKRFASSFSHPYLKSIYSRDEALYMKLGWTNGIWVWMIRRDFLIRNNIFSPNYSYGEDAPFVWRVISCSNYIGQIDYTGYLYWMNDTSMMHTLSKDYWETYAPSRRDIISFVHPINPEVAGIIDSIYRIESVIWASKSRYFDYIQGLRKNKLKPIRIYGLWRYWSKKNFFLGILFNISPSLVYMILNRSRIITNISSRFLRNH